MVANVGGKTNETTKVSCAAVLFPPQRQIWAMYGPSILRISNLLTDSIGLPRTRAPRATAHQNTQAEGPTYSSFPSNVFPNSPPTAIVSGSSTSTLSSPGADCCREAGLSRMLTIVSRMWLQLRQAERVKRSAAGLGMHATRTFNKSVPLYSTTYLAHDGLQQYAGA